MIFVFKRLWKAKVFFSSVRLASAGVRGTEHQLGLTRADVQLSWTGLASGRGFAWPWGLAWQGGLGAWRCLGAGRGRGCCHRAESSPGSLRGSWPLLGGQVKTKRVPRKLQRENRLDLNGYKMLPRTHFRDAPDVLVFSRKRSGPFCNIKIPMPFWLKHAQP